MYATVQEFIQAFTENETAELEDISSTHLSGDTDRIQSTLDDSGSEINTFIGGRYALPLTVKVPYLVYAEIRIARKNLYQYEESDKVRRDYEDVIKRLTAIGAGLAGLVDSTGSTLQPIVDPQATETNNPSNIYTGNRVVYVPSFGNLQDRLYRNPYSEQERLLP